MAIADQMQHGGRTFGGMCVAGRYLPSPALLELNKPSWKELVPQGQQPKGETEKTFWTFAVGWFCPMHKKAGFS